MTKKQEAMTALLAIRNTACTSPGAVMELMDHLSLVEDFVRGTADVQEPLDFMNPEDLTELADQLAHYGTIVSKGQVDGMEADAEQHVVIAMGHECQAVAHLRLAALAQSRALAAARGVR